MRGLLKNLYTLTCTQKVSNDRNITRGIWCHAVPVYKRTGFDGLPIFTGRHKSLGICHLRCYHSKSTFILPWQVFPSPVYPALQVQIYDPRVLEQLALMSHTGVEAPHSSMSRTTNILIDEKNYWRAFTQALTCDGGSTHSFMKWVFFSF